MSRPRRQARARAGALRQTMFGAPRLPAIAVEFRAAFRDGALPARLTVTSIILLTVLGGLELTPPEAWVMATYLMLSAGGIHLAGAYGEVIGREFGRRKSRPDGEFRGFLVERNALAALSLWIAAACVFAVSALGPMSVTTAFLAAQMSLVGLLSGLGFLSRYLNGRKLSRCFWGGASVALVGLLLSDLRLLADAMRGL